jgi:two-component system response regulator HupR/HoxA
MQRNGEWVVLLVGSALATDRALRKRLTVDYELLSANTLVQATRLMDTGNVDVVITEQQYPDGRAVDFLQKMRVAHPDAIRILVMNTVRQAEIVQLINDAAIYQVVRAPWEPEQISLMLKRALESRELARRHRYLSHELKFADVVMHRQNDHMVRELQQTYEFDKLVFCSNAMAEVCNLARKAAATDLPVLIEGETGTGKELMARALHMFSTRSEQIFLAQNCGELPDSLLQSELFGHTRGAFTGAVGNRLGLFPAADGGTVFLDEISDISPAMQVSLLRFLQEGEFKPVGADQTRHSDVRIIAASNRPLNELVAEGRFRRDLYYRLRGFELNIPPLRERPEDIQVLADYLIKKYADKSGRHIAGISSDAMQKIRQYTFPGNVRELENEVRRMVAMTENGTFITIDQLSPEIAQSRPSLAQLRGIELPQGEAVTLKHTVEFVEAQMVRQALHRHHWNHSRAARELGLSRVGLDNKIKRYAIQRDSEGASPHVR